MPLYEFQCKKCGARFDELCSAQEEGENIICPICGRKGAKRLLSSFSSPGVKGGNGCEGCTGKNCDSCR